MSTPTPENKKTISAYDLKMYGSIYGDDACGNCTDAHDFFKDAKSKSKVPIHYSHIDMDSSEAKELMQKEKIEVKPYIEACKIYEDGEKECTKVNKWDKNDWKYLIGSDEVTTPAITAGTTTTEANKKKA